MKLRIIPLGGVEEVGKNCIAFECGPDIIVVDMGFDFPGPDLPGVDYILPDISYLERNKSRIRGIVITHGHLDHIGAIPYLVKKLGNPQIFGTELTIGLIQGRLEEDGLRYGKLTVISPDKPFSLGTFEIDPFHVVHNIPDSLGLAIKTSQGIIIHTGDFKFDESPLDQQPIKKQRLRNFAARGVIALLSDSTNATLPGRVVSEKKVGRVITSIIADARGRIIFTTFSTLISRIQQVINTCQKYGRKIAIAGLSIKKSIAIAEELGYLTVPPKLFIDLEKIKEYPDKEILILAGGAQGVEGSSMVRISRGQHRLVKIRKPDTVALSSSAIPGNELAIYRMMDGIASRGGRIIYQPVLGLGVHSSGHAFQEDLREMLKLVRPKFFIPVEGSHYMQAAHIELAIQTGIKEENCFMLRNGEILEIDERGRAQILAKKVAGLFIVVEGKRVKVLKEKILNVRRKMAESGICVLNVSQRKKYMPEIKIAFQGLVVDDKTVTEVKNKVKKLIRKYGLKANFKSKIEASLGDFLLNKIGKKPLVVII